MNNLADKKEKFEKQLLNLQEEVKIFKN